MSLFHGKSVCILGSRAPDRFPDYDSPVGTRVVSTPIASPQEVRQVLGDQLRTWFINWRNRRRRSLRRQVLHRQHSMPARLGYSTAESSGTYFTALFSVLCPDQNTSSLRQLFLFHVVSFRCKHLRVLGETHIRV